MFKRIFLLLLFSIILNANNLALKGIWKFEQYEESNPNEPYDLLNLNLEITKNHKTRGDFEYFFRWFSKVEDLKEFNSTLNNNVFYFSFDSNFEGKDGEVKISINKDCSLDWELIKEPNGEYYAPYKVHLKVEKLDINDEICQYPKKIIFSLTFLSGIEKTLKEKKDPKTYNQEFFKNLLVDQPLSEKNLTQYNNIAYYLEKAGANEEAVFLLEKILDKYPNRTVAHYNLGDAYWGLGETDKAIASYQTYIQQMKANGKEKRIPQVVLDRVSGKK